jgi:hypothetical protein
MAAPFSKAIVAALLERHGRTYGEELGIRVESNTPSVLFQWLVAAILFSARIGAGQAVKATKAIKEKGWTTPRKMAASTWRERTDTLNRAGYARYDESTSRMLGDTTALLMERYRGDLRRLRDEAGHDPAKERRLLKEFKGIGDVGVDIFFREAQSAWDELFPFADKKAMAAARRLGLGKDANALSSLVSRAEYPRLVGALVRTDLAKDDDAVREAARQR